MASTVIMTPDSSATVTLSSAAQTVAALGQAGRSAQRSLALMPSAQRAASLRYAAQALRDAAPAILKANAGDCEAGQAAGLSGAMLDRLRLDPQRLEEMAGAVAAIAELPDPVGEIIDRRERPNGLVLERVRIPVGLIGDGGDRASHLLQPLGVEPQPVEHRARQPGRLPGQIGRAHV